MLKVSWEVGDGAGWEVLEGAKNTTAKEWGVTVGKG